MKKMLLFCLMFLFWSSFVKADLGSCVLYHAQFHLKDGSNLRAYFEYAGYFEGSWLEDGTNEFCSDEGILQLFKKHQKERGEYGFNSGDGGLQKSKEYGKVAVYKSLKSLKAQRVGSKNKFDKQPQVYGEYAFTKKVNIVFLDSTEINKLDFLGAEFCERDWLQTEIVVGTEELIETVKYQQYWNDLFVDLSQSKPDSIAFQSLGSMWGYHLLNYNPQNNIAELKRLANLKLKFLTRPNPYWEALKEENEITPKLKQVAREKFERDIQVVKDWFWERGIVMVRVNGTC